MGCAGSISTPGVGVRWPREPLIGEPPWPRRIEPVDTAPFVVDRPGRIWDFYDLGRKSIGEGTYGSVTKGRSRSTGSEYAVKAIPKSQIRNSTRFKQEVAIIKLLDHPNIIKLRETFHDYRNIYLVMELCEGGELFDRVISDAGRFTENQASVLMAQLARAVYYMHENRVCHRDLKPENFLFVSKDPVSQNLLKIIDFGLACRFEPGQVLNTKAGTPFYVAPQVLSGAYDSRSDLWSCGVIMFVMLCGYPPFAGQSDSEVLSKVRVGSFAFDARDWKDVSEEAKDLIRLLLKTSPEERISAHECLSCEWIRRKAPNAPKDSLGADAPVGRGLEAHLRLFRSQSRLKKAALRIIADQLREDQIRYLRDAFAALDTDRDGLLSPVEMRAGLETVGLDISKDLQVLMQDVDPLAGGTIDHMGFLAAALSKRLFLQENRCWAVFGRFDKQRDGWIPTQDLKQVVDDPEIGPMLAPQTVEEVAALLDPEQRGMVYFDDFMAMVRTTKPNRAGTVRAYQMLGLDVRDPAYKDIAPGYEYQAGEGWASPFLLGRAVQTVQPSGSSGSPTRAMGRGRSGSPGPRRLPSPGPWGSFPAGPPSP